MNERMKELRDLLKVMKRKEMQASEATIHFQRQERQEIPERDSKSSAMKSSRRELFPELGADEKVMGYAADEHANAYDELCLFKGQVMAMLGAKEDATCSSLVKRIRELRKSANGECYRIVEYYR